MLADPAAFEAVVEALAEAGRDASGAGRWSTTWSAWRRAGSSSPRRWRWPSAPGSCRCARPASCPARRTPRPTRSSTARPRWRSTATGSRPGDRVLLVDDVLATGGTVAATRAWSSAAARSPHGVAVLMDLSFLPGREAIGDLPLTSLMTV